MSVLTINPELFATWQPGSKMTTETRRSDVRRLGRAINADPITADRNEIIAFIQTLPLGPIRKRVASSLRNFYSHAIAVGAITDDPMAGIVVVTHDDAKIRL